MSEFISVSGAREHNLKNISVEIPREKLVVITGLSGSGKSSLAFDTIYAEGQRRYVESLSSYARQFLGLMEKPDVDQIDGLSPAISIDQKSTSRNPRSTVATVTEIYDYLRLLFARIGVPHCPIDGNEVRRLTPQAIVDEVLAMPSDAKLLILAPIVNAKKGQFEHVPGEYQRSGFARARVDGVIYSLDEWPELDKKYKHTIEIVVDRLTNTKDKGFIGVGYTESFGSVNEDVFVIKYDSLLAFGGQVISVKETKPSFDFFKVYPSIITETNPMLSIQKTSDTKMEFVLFDINAKQILLDSNISNQASGKLLFNLSSINPGVYLLRGEANGYYQYVKFIKQ